MKDMVRSMLSGAAAAAFFLLLFLGAKWNFFMCVLLAAGLFEAVYLISRPRKRIGRVAVDQMENGEELKKKLDEAREDFLSISRSMNQIGDPEAEGEYKACNPNLKYGF